MVGAKIFGVVVVVMSVFVIALVACTKIIYRILMLYVLKTNLIFVYL